jgi:hypothetical protein
MNKILQHQHITINNNSYNDQDTGEENILVVSEDEDDENNHTFLSLHSMKTISTKPVTTTIPEYREIVFKLEQEHHARKTKLQEQFKHTKTLMEQEFAAINAKMDMEYGMLTTRMDQEYVLKITKLHQEMDQLQQQLDSSIIQTIVLPTSPIRSPRLDQNLVIPSLLENENNTSCNLITK